MATLGVPALRHRLRAGVGDEVVINVVDRIGGRVEGEHPGSEGPLEGQRVGSVGQGGQPSAQGRQLRNRLHPGGRAKFSPAQVLEPLHRAGPEGEAQCCCGQDGQVVIAASRGTGQGRERGLGPDPVKERMQQHRPGITGEDRALPDAGQRRRPLLRNSAGIPGGSAKDGLCVIPGGDGCLCVRTRVVPGIHLALGGTAGFGQ